MMKDYISAHIHNNYSKEYEFLTSFDCSRLISGITETVRLKSNISYDLDFAELLEVSNYEKYFKSKYGIENCTKESVKATEKFIDFVDSLTKGIKNKESFIWAINAYLVNPDKTEIHTTLHR